MTVTAKEIEDMPDLKDRIRIFIVEHYLFGDDEGLNNDSSFLDEGIIDSTGILELIDFIDQEFSITVKDEELLPENLDSINNLSAYIEKKTFRQNHS